MYVSIFIGVSVGIITYIFGTGLLFIISKSNSLFPYNIMLLPIAGICTLYLKNKYKNDVDGSMSKVFLATSQNNKLSLLIIPFQIVSTWFAHLAGASVGREGVAVQLGATLANNLNNDRIKVSKQNLTKIGMSAGFAGLFGTPLAATYFCFEVTKAKHINIKLISITLAASYIASFVSSLLGLNHFHFNVEFEQMTILQLLMFVISIILIVNFGHLFAYILKKLKNNYNNLNLNEYIKIIIFSVIGMIFIINICDGRYISLGTNIINDAFYNPSNINYFDFLFKMIFTTYFIAIGFQGGEVTPLFAIGASLGVTLSVITGLPTVLLAATGYGVMFGAATNAYVASIILIVEIFGFNIIPYAFIALLIMIKIKKYEYSIYPNFK